MTFSPEDVAVVRLVCGECGNDYGWNNGSKSTEIPENCPCCEHPWKANDFRRWQWAVRFLHLTKALSRAKDDPRLSIRLEVDMDKGV